MQIERAHRTGKAKRRPADAGNASPKRPRLGERYLSFRNLEAEKCYIERFYSRDYF